MVVFLRGVSRRGILRSLFVPAQGWEGREQLCSWHSSRSRAEGTVLLCAACLLKPPHDMVNQKLPAPRASPGYSSWPCEEWWQPPAAGLNWTVQREQVLRDLPCSLMEIWIYVLFHTLVVSPLLPPVSSTYIWIFEQRSRKQYLEINPSCPLNICFRTRVSGWGKVRGEWFICLSVESRGPPGGQQFWLPSAWQAALGHKRLP